MMGIYTKEVRIMEIDINVIVYMSEYQVRLLVNKNGVWADRDGNELFGYSWGWHNMVDAYHDHWLWVLSAYTDMVTTDVTMVGEEEIPF